MYIYSWQGAFVSCDDRCHGTFYPSTILWLHAFMYVVRVWMCAEVDISMTPDLRTYEDWYVGEARRSAFA